MNLGQEEEEEDSSSQETCAEVEHHQLHPEEEDEEEKENKEDEAGLLLAASAIPSPNHGFPSNKNNNPSSSFQSPPPPSVIPYKDFFPEHHASLLWHDLSHRRLDLVDLSLGSSNGGGAAGPSMEHMFDKVVTPSDVGKLNRLVIPKQHAEKYFPLDSSSNDNGLLLNFEDRNGKPWRFRYSYWNSSQSYVMTKGWSRFVKENKLDAGDIVSFQRGVGEAGKHRLYIDWRRRPNAPDPLPFPHQHNHHLDLQLHFPQSVRWGTLYSLPQSLSNYPTSSVRQYDYPHHPPPRHHHDQQLDYGTINHPYGPNLQYQQQQQQYYLSPPGTTAQYPIAAGMGGEQMVIDSVPVVHGKKVGKRLRLFGVNMECQPDDASSFSMDVRYPYHHQQQQQQRGRMISSIPSPHHSYLSSSSSSSNIPRLQFQGLPAATTGTTTSTTSQMAMQQHHRQQQEYSKKGKTASSLSFDLDL